ncbi:TonB-dependent receptor [candidate division KSB1 bacterium]|nr:TonB-dependent receptor [candidate division KSB1 bacterium]
MKNAIILWCAAFLLFCTVATAQQLATISGTVRDDETGEALVGCNVVIAGTTIGATTEAQGNFQLTGMPYGKATLVASFIGYETKRREIEIAQPNVLVNFRLTPAAIAGPAVTVVATRGRERETPAAFSTLTQNDIQARYAVQDLPVLLSELPSTKFYSESGNGVGYNYLSIRGFDQRRISVLINGVPQNDPEDHNVYWVDFPDLLANVEDIQVQRGAGSAFYGPPAIGGSVNIITSHFSPERRISAYVGGGTYDTRRYSLALNSGLLRNKYMLFGRFSRIQSDGYRDRSWVDFKSYFLGAARVGEKSTTRLHFYGGPIEDHLAYYGISKESANRRDLRRENSIRRPDEIENFNQPHLELIHEYRANDRLRLNNTVFWVRGYGFFDYDGSWAPMSYYRLTPQYGFAVTGNPEEVFVDSLLIRAYVDNIQYGWLPQITWLHGRGDLTMGAELRVHRSLHWGRIQDGDSDLPRAIAGEFRGLSYVGSRRYYEYRGAKNIISPYLHATYLLRPNLNVMFDLQLAHLQYRLYDEKFIGTEFTRPYNFLNPRIGINYNFNEQLNVFANFSRTSREPRLKNFYDAAEASTPESWGAVVPQFEINPDGRYNFDKPLVNPETLNDYEFGVAYRNGGWRASVNFFYMDFKDEIIKQGQLDRFGQPITGNAERTLHTGIELITSARIFPKLTLSGNLMLSRNELKKYSVFQSDGTRQILDGNPIAGFPDALANARLTFADFGLIASLAMQYVGKQYTDNFKNEQNTVDPYTVFNGMMGYTFTRGSMLGGLSLQLHVQNLFDKLYIMHGEGEEFFPAAERQIFVNAKYDL